jgi:hypothetical protein
MMLRRLSATPIPNVLIRARLESYRSTGTGSLPRQPPRVDVLPSSGGAAECIAKIVEGPSVAWIEVYRPRKLTGSQANTRPGETVRYDITKDSVRNPQDFFARRPGGINGVHTKHAETRAKMVVAIGRRHPPVARLGASVSRMPFRRTSVRMMPDPR